jgi:3alpha(or 20beta)-hydroxysteroid dehydrogenase
MWAFVVGREAAVSRLRDKVAAITGGAVGMGAAHARLFVEEGAKVVVGDVNSAEGERLAAQLGESAAFVQLDVSDPQSWESRRWPAIHTRSGRPTCLHRSQNSRSAV